MFRDVRFPKFSWVKSITRSDNFVNEMWCKLFTSNDEGRETLLVAKLNSLYKCVGCKKSKTNIQDILKHNLLL